MAAKSVSFPVWPKWNFHFPELDVSEIKAVRYWPKDGEAALEYPLDKVRLVTGHNGVSGIVFKEKNELPELKQQGDAVTVDYEV